MSRIMPLSALLLFASMPQLAAQVDDASRYDALFHPAGSEMSGRIPSRLVDPFTTTAQVDRFLEFLKLPYQFEWDGTTTLRDIQKDIARHFPLEIDIYAIEEIGLSDDDAIHKELAPKNAAVTNRQVDPFGNSPGNETGALSGRRTHKQTGGARREVVAFRSPRRRAADHCDERGPAFFLPRSHRMHPERQTRSAGNHDAR